MNTSTAEHIDNLIKSSGIISSNFIDNEDLNDLDLSGETILITGAAGSIGSELSKQISRYKFKTLILIDSAESPLYGLIKDFEFQDVSNIKFIILNITDHDSLKHLFEKHRPTLIFHAAAYKHVPLMELNPYEAIKVNIFGTKCLAELSIKYDVGKFVFISTDKAVNPKSVMGMTKQIGEKHLKFLNSKNKTIFSITRFGNIIGSNGSLLPLLKKQVESGLPITITDRETSRYFINRQSACHLILKVSAFERAENNTFTFEMGEPIKIVDLLNRLLFLYKVSEDEVEIKFTGLRSGEKLHEAIISEEEIIIQTKFKNVFRIKSMNGNYLNELDFTKLEKITPFQSNLEVKSILQSFNKNL